METNPISVTRWWGAEHPSYQTIAKLLEREGLRPYRWQNGANFRYAARTHHFDKVLYCIQGTLEILLPDFSERIVLRPGDRIELSRGVRYAQIVGPEGAACVECRRQEHFNRMEH